MKLYRIRIAPERAPDVWRVFEFAARHTLRDVHLAIVNAFELDDGPSYAFYLPGKNGDEASRIQGPESPSDVDQTARVRLYSLRIEIGKRFTHLVELRTELCHWLELQAVTDVDAAPVEPRLVESVGIGSKQARGEPLDVDALLPLANELIALFPVDEAAMDPDADELEGNEDDADELEGNEGDPFEDDEPPVLDLADEVPPALDLTPEALRAAHDVATRLANELGGDLDRFDALQEANDVDLMNLLADLPYALGQAEMVDEGAELARALSFLDPPHFLGERAIVLADAGRRDEALAQVAQNLESLAGDHWTEVKAADAYAALGDTARAEALLRAVLAEHAEGHRHDGALDRLLELLTIQGRTAEVDALLSAERSRLDALARQQTETVQRLAPKVGRNDPCPCGSGKKHKRCCLL